MRANNFVLSPSKLETFRCYLKEEYNGYVTKQSVIDTVLGVRKYSKKMDFGTAYHEMLEHGVDSYLCADFEGHEFDYKVKVEDNYFYFKKKDVDPIVHFRNQYPNTSYECWLGFTIKLGNINVRFRSRVDGIEGRLIHEFKTTSNTVKVESYERSCQWKLYTLGLGVRAVQYHTFQYKMSKDTLKQVIPLDFKFYRTETTDQEVYSLIHDFIDFCYSQGIEDKIIDVQ